MKEYIYFEYKKVARHNCLLLFCVILFCLNISMLLVNYREHIKHVEENGGYYPGRQLFVEQIEGQIDQELIDYLNLEYKNIMNGHMLQTGVETYTGFQQADQMMIEQISEKINEYVQYRSYAERVVERAESNVIYYQKHGNTYLVRENKQIIKAFTDRSIKEYYDLIFMEEYLNYDFSSVLLLGLILFMGVMAFQNEKECGAECLQKLHCSGRKTSMAKWIVGQGILCGMALLLYGMDFCFYTAGWSLNGWEMPVFSLDEYIQTGINCSIIGFACAMVVSKLIGLATLYGIVFALSKFLKNYMFAYSTGFLFLALSIYGIKEIRLWNPGTLLQPRLLTQTWETVNVGGIPIQLLYYMMGYCVLVQCVCLAVVMVSWWKEENGY